MAISIQSLEILLFFSVPSTLAITLTLTLGNILTQDISGSSPGNLQGIFFVVTLCLFSSRFFFKCTFTYKMSGSLVSLYRHLCPFCMFSTLYLNNHCFSCSTTRLRFSSHMSGSVMIVCWQYWNYPQGIFLNHRQHCKGLKVPLYYLLSYLSRSRIYFPGSRFFVYMCYVPSRPIIDNAENALSDS